MTTLPDQLDIPRSFLALSLPARLRILQVLHPAREPFATSLVAQLVDSEPSVTSKHLQILLEAGLVSRVPAGRYALWSLRREVFQELALVLQELGKEVESESP